MSTLVRKLLLMGIVISCVPACMIVNDFKENLKAYEHKPEDQFPFHHSSPEFRVSWDTQRSGNDTIVDGLVTNVRNTTVQGISLKIDLLDADGKRLTQGVAPPTALNLKIYDTFSFNAILKDTQIAPGNILFFIITYSTYSGSWGGNSEQKSFKVEATSGNEIEK